MMNAYDKSFNLLDMVAYKVELAQLIGGVKNDFYNYFCFIIIVDLCLTLTYLT